MTIRRTPQDFRVEEQPTQALLNSLAPTPTPTTPHAVFQLTKNSLTTPEAEQRLAKALSLKPNALQHAGLKDKHAITTQLVSCSPSKTGARAEGWVGLCSSPAPSGGGVMRVFEHDAGGVPQHSFPREGLGWISSASELQRQGDDASTPLPPQGHWQAHLLGYAREPASAVWIASNRFTITVRDLTPAHSDTIDRHLALLALDSTSLLFTNYFGDQRFGSARHKQGFVATHLIRAEFEQALQLAIATPARKDTGNKRTFTRQLAQNWGHWKSLSQSLPRCPERAAIESLARGESFLNAFAALPFFTQRICVEAYQSYLWNKIAAAIAASAASAQPDHAANLIRANDDFGLMLFPPASAIAPAEHARQLPMPAPQSRIPDWADSAYERILAEERLNLDQLRIPGLRRPTFDAFDRPLFAIATNFSFTPPEPDDLSKGAKRVKRTLRFDLPSGSYATVLLRALGQ